MKAGLFSRSLSTIVDMILIILVLFGLFMIGGRPIIRNSIDNFDTYYSKYNSDNDIYNNNVSAAYDLYTETNESDYQGTISEAIISDYRNIVSSNTTLRVNDLELWLDKKLNDIQISEHTTLLSRILNVYTSLEKDETKKAELKTNFTAYSKYFEDSIIKSEEKDALVTVYQEWEAFFLERINGNLAKFTEDDYNTVVAEFEYEINRNSEAYATPMLKYFVSCMFFFLYGFIFLAIIYTLVLKGKTLGRMIFKIKLAGRINILTLLIHDIVLKYLPFVVLFMYTQIGAIYALIVMFLLDFVFITFTKDKMALRDAITGISVENKNYIY